MLNFLKKLFGVYEAPKAEAPYKVEAAPEVKAPEPAKCGCGRSPSGYCVGLHALTTEAWAVHPDNPNKVEVKVEAPVAEAAPAKKVRSAKPKASDAKKAAKPKKPKTKQ